MTSNNPHCSFSESGGDLTMGSDQSCGQQSTLSLNDPPSVSQRGEQCTVPAARQGGGGAKPNTEMKNRQASFTRTCGQTSPKSHEYESGLKFPSLFPASDFHQAERRGGIEGQILAELFGDDVISMSFQSPRERKKDPQSLGSKPQTEERRANKPWKRARACDRSRLTGDDRRTSPFRLVLLRRRP